MRVGHPGELGAQQALASFLLRGYAPVSAVTAYSLGQQLTLTGWNVALGVVLLWSTIGRKEAHDFGRRRGDAAWSSSALQSRWCLGTTSRRDAPARFGSIGVDTLWAVVQYERCRANVVSTELE
jgi:hypothetical protein